MADISTVKESLHGWGGDWTRKKIEILIEYAKAYLLIMHKHPYWKLLYFDGFAGSGLIAKDDKIDLDITIGAACRIVEIDEPRPFDYYYFVEKDKHNAEQLRQNTKQAFPNKNITIKIEDCNVKLKDLANYLQTAKGKKTRVLAYLDPYGMQLEWSSIIDLAKAGIDMWILTPTGMGVNRLLKNNGEISDIWLDRLKKFLGLSEEDIRKYFYKEEIDYTLFGVEKHLNKEENAIEKAGKLYKCRLETVFKFVSKPFILRSGKGNIMYHMFLSSNNNTAVKIANDIVKKYNNMS
jgi:three-Cys-motif partner protein